MSNDDLTKRIKPEIIDALQKLSEDKPDRLTLIVESLREQIQTLQQTVDKRKYDTGPLWESAIARLDSIDAKIEPMQAEIKKELVQLRRLFELLAIRTTQLESYHRENEGRLEKLEDKIRGR
jgi:hypothetical protein